ncbi:hypothetical protein FALBO_17383 [Fusarium albosuccineum]|uniref:Uncharacterized protein n=1 Tax=Fusarium albosuccineum TaxID=1237068 RepID=A0A8H4NKV1_9HYPO|nr:hypothetical protein FALBO_17383 [Fusarium albosuccineum]
MHRPAEVNHPRQAQGPVKAASTRTKKDLGSGQAGNSRPALPSGPVKVWDRASLTASWSHPHEATMWLFGRCAQGRFLGGDPLAGRQPLYPGASDRHPRTLDCFWAHGAQPDKYDNSAADGCRQRRNKLGNSSWQKQKKVTEPPPRMTQIPLVWPSAVPNWLVPGFRHWGSSWHEVNSASCRRIGLGHDRRG